MVMDYKNINQPRHKKSNKGKFILLFALAAMLFSGGLLYLHHHKITQIKIAKAKELQQPTKKSTAAVQQQYDFYTLLPSSTTNPSTPIKAGAYVLQVASLRDKNAANEMRDHLKALGFPAFVQTYESNNIAWSRVIVGPYQTSADSQSAQSKLSDDKISTIILKVKT